MPEPDLCRHGNYACATCVRESREPKMVSLDDHELDLILNWYADSHSTGNPEWDEEADDLAEKLKAARRC